MFPSRTRSLTPAWGAAVAACSLLAADPFDQSRVPLEVAQTDARLARVVLLAGSPSNKAGQHEYFAGCALLMNWLHQLPHHPRRPAISGARRDHCLGLYPSQSGPLLCFHRLRPPPKLGH